MLAPLSLARVEEHYEFIREDNSQYSPEEYYEFIRKDNLLYSLEDRLIMDERWTRAASFQGQLCLSLLYASVSVVSVSTSLYFHVAYTVVYHSKFLYGCTY